MVCLPLSASDELGFLDELSLELTRLDKSLESLETLSTNQRNELENLSTLSTSLQMKVGELTSQLEGSQKELTQLKTQYTTLEGQWGDLRNSLDESVKELSGLKVKNGLLIAGISITVGLSLVAIIMVAK